jgi:broad specificity phosphatase PhoE
MVMQFNNRYFAMRHGRSLANEQGIIVSDPVNGVLEEYGLSVIGRQQAEKSALSSGLNQDALIYTSDFSRAHQTAEIVRRVIGAKNVVIAKPLRERYFGDWEKTAHDNYKKVYELDRVVADRHANNVESLNSVLTRTLRLVTAIEQAYKDRDILLVSHGDTLQILQAGISGYSPTKHCDLPYLKTAEIRRLV